MAYSVRNHTVRNCRWIALSQPRAFLCEVGKEEHLEREKEKDRKRQVREEKGESKTVHQVPSPPFENPFPKRQVEHIDGPEEKENIQYKNLQNDSESDPQKHPRTTASRQDINSYYPSISIPHYKWLSSTPWVRYEIHSAECKISAKASIHYRTTEGLKSLISTSLYL